MVQIKQQWVQICTHNIGTAINHAKVCELENANSTGKPNKIFIAIHCLFPKFCNNAIHVQEYNENLARMAQEWADRCVMKHRPHGSYNPQTYGFQEELGESIWAWSAMGSTIPDKPIMDWFNEKTDYNFDSNTCTPGKPCGHYIAVCVVLTTSWQINSFSLTSPTAAEKLK